MQTVTHQSMSARTAQAKIDVEAQNFGALIRDGHWTLEHAHQVLVDGAAKTPGLRGLNLFEIAGLAKAIACFQCSE